MTCDAKAIANDHRPRLRIAHLLCWIAGSALGFEAYHRLVPITLNPRTVVAVGVYNSLMGMCLGTILTGVGIMVYRRWRHKASYPFLPGHWLLIFGLAAALSDGLAIGVYRNMWRRYYPPEKWPPGTVFHLPRVYLIQFRVSLVGDVIGVYHQAVGWGLGAVAALALLWHTRGRLTWSWLAVFLLLFLTAATLSCGHISSLIQVHRTATLWPIRLWCAQSAHVYAKYILACAFTMLGAIAWDVRRVR